MVTKRIITRSQAERLISEHQKDMLRRLECYSTWELYADFGAGHCCGGIFRLRDEELRQAYYRLIPGIQAMDRERMVDAIIGYERSRVGGDGLITCQDVAQTGRVCDGLNRYTNTELAEWFSDALGYDVQVADDPVEDDELPLSRALVYVALIAVLVLLVGLFFVFLGQ